MTTACVDTLTATRQNPDAMPRGNQHTRQWCLLQVLGRPQGLAVVWRDLRVLQGAGFPIYDDRDGRRGLGKVEESFRQRLPVPLSLPEIVARLVSAEGSGRP